MGKQAQSVDYKIISRIRGHGRGWVFTPADFHDLGGRNAIALALMRHTRAGTIRQLARGLYDYPRQDPRLGILAASTDDIAKVCGAGTIFASRLRERMPPISWDYRVRCQPEPSTSRMVAAGKFKSVNARSF